MEAFKIEIDRRQIVESINVAIQETVKQQLVLKKVDIEKSIIEYFDKGFVINKTSAFDGALDYTIEAAFREGVAKAMDELNFKEVIASKTKEMLTDNNFIQELAEAKVRSSLGLPPKA